MRYLILSDIHANWEALQAVRAHVRRKRFDRVLMGGRHSDPKIPSRWSNGEVMSLFVLIGSLIEFVQSFSEIRLAGIRKIEKKARHF